MFDQDGYFIIKNEEEAKFVESFLINNKYEKYSGVSKNEYSEYRPILRFYKNKGRSNTYQFLKEDILKMIINAQEFILNDIIKPSVESQLREIFDNPNNVIFCNTIEEKHKLFKLLDKLKYKTQNGNSYLNNTNFLELSQYIKPSKGVRDSLKVAKKYNYNIIYFSDLKNLIK